MLKQRMESLLETLQSSWKIGDAIFFVFLLLSFLTTLYAVTLIYRKIRVIESELAAMRKDQTVISEELELVARVRPDRAVRPPAAR